MTMKSLCLKRMGRLFGKQGQGWQFQALAGFDERKSKVIELHLPWKWRPRRWALVLPQGFVTDPLEKVSLKGGDPMLTGVHP